MMIAVAVRRVTTGSHEPPGFRGESLHQASRVKLLYTSGWLQGHVTQRWIRPPTRDPFREYGNSSIGGNSTAKLPRTCRRKFTDLEERGTTNSYRLNTNEAALRDICTAASKNQTGDLQHHTSNVNKDHPTHDVTLCSPPQACQDVFGVASRD